MLLTALAAATIATAPELDCTRGYDCEQLAREVAAWLAPRCPDCGPGIIYTKTRSFVTVSGPLTPDDAAAMRAARPKRPGR